MGKVKFKRISIIIVSIVLGIAFFVESPLCYILLKWFYVYPLELFAFALGSALLICLIVITRKYLSITNILKAFCLIILFPFVDLFVSVVSTSMDVLALVYQLVRPWLATLVILLLFLWISKCRIAKDKILFTLIGISYVMGAILNVSEYLSMRQYTSELSANEFFGYLNLLDGANSINSFVSVLCFYVQILIVFLLLIESLYLYGKEPIKEKIQSDKGNYVDETEELIATPGENWKCMGCGQLVPIENDRCTCGYKK